jgi:hypothetical protein
MYEPSLFKIGEPSSLSKAFEGIVAIDKMALIKCLTVPVMLKVEVLVPVITFVVVAIIQKF